MKPSLFDSGTPSEAPDVLEGALAKILFQKETFLIALLEGGEKVAGDLPQPRPGGAYRFEGRWEEHPKFGRQFRFLRAAFTPPSSAEGIRRYLHAYAAGVGEVLSERLVEAFGEEALKICREDPERVAREIKGMTHAKALQVSTILRDHAETEAARLELDRLTGDEPSGRRAARILWERFGVDAAERIRGDPYRLVAEVEGIGFRTADALALRLGYDPHDPRRLSAAVEFLLSEAAEAQGHTCLGEEQLVERACALLGADPETIQEAAERAVRDRRVVRHEGDLALRTLHEAEESIARSLAGLLSQPPRPVAPRLAGLFPDQETAVERACASRVFVLTGAAGTGKTHAILRILESFSGGTLALAAPTGKAAKRMQEATGRDATTMHRLLEPQKWENGFVFTRNERNTIDADLVVLDEVSMVDVRLMAAFLKAVPPSARLVLVGDPYQLPSVGPGNVLGELLRSKAVPFEELTRIKRQNPGLLLTNCHRIKNGEPLEIRPADDFQFVQLRSEEAIAEKLVELAQTRGAQVLTPLRERTAFACSALNPRLRELLNPGPAPEAGGWRSGDRVLQTRNDYEREIWNGDLGRVAGIDAARGELTVNFALPDRRITLPAASNDLELGYALTVHKSQGSEWPAVALPVHRAVPPMLAQRNLLYTAVSRARDCCVLVGDPTAAVQAIGRNAPLHRRSHLAGFLRRALA